ncbi:MAG TPA: GAF domain-containing protein, partial [Myxococcales bacterium]|nr:GAF domain-containing protein [Myxococcales bacterium]
MLAEPRRPLGLFLALLAVGDVDKDGDGSGHGARGIAQGSGGERQVEVRAVLALPAHLLIADDPPVVDLLTDAENARGVLAFPLQFGDELLGVLRVSSRTAWKFSEDEKRFLRAIATRAAALLAGDDP